MHGLLKRGRPSSLAEADEGDVEDAARAPEALTES